MALYIPGGAGFLPSTVSPIKSNIHCNLYVFLVLTYLLGGNENLGDLILFIYVYVFIQTKIYVCVFPINLQMVSKQCVKKYC